MNRTTLGRTGIEVSAYCLGTMTFGTQTSEADSHAQIDQALAAGVDFIDTAEMYPVNPVKAETVGRTEEIIGNWNAKSTLDQLTHILEGLDVKLPKELIAEVDKAHRAHPMPY